MLSHVNFLSHHYNVSTTWHCAGVKACQKFLWNESSDQTRRRLRCKFKKTRLKEQYLVETTNRSEALNTEKLFRTGVAISGVATGGHGCMSGGTWIPRSVPRLPLLSPLANIWLRPCRNAEGNLQYCRLAEYILIQESPADARVARDSSACIPPSRIFEISKLHR